MSFYSTLTETYVQMFRSLPLKRQQSVVGISAVVPTSSGEESGTVWAIFPISFAVSEGLRKEYQTGGKTNHTQSNTTTIIFHIYRKHLTRSIRRHEGTVSLRNNEHRLQSVLVRVGVMPPMIVMEKPR